MLEAIAFGVIFVPGMAFVAAFAHATRILTWEQSQRQYERAERKRARQQIRSGQFDELDNPRVAC